MVIVMKAGATDTQIDGVRQHVESCGARTYFTRDGGRAALACPNPPKLLLDTALATLPGVEATAPWGTPYRLASRQCAPPEGRTSSALGTARAQPSVGPNSW